jgi:uncharacterized protein YjbI with pentapeptide repeats
MVEPGSQDASEALVRRWLEPVEGGGTRRDAALSALREAGRPADRDLRGINLAGEDLSGVDFSQCDLSGAHLSEATFEGAKFLGCHLEGATLFKASLEGCELLGAHLAGAELSECRAARAGFGGANLTRATLFGADLTGATLSQGNLEGADLRTAKLEGARLREAVLARTNLSRADLRSGDLEGADLTGADFHDADLRAARLKNVTGYDRATWIGADIRDVDFCGAYMVRRHIMDENFLDEFRRRSRLSEVMYRIWWATSDCGRSFTRWALWVAFVAVVFAGLYSFVDLDFGDHQTWLSPLYFSVVTMTTLGYGDVLPASSPAQVVAMAEVILGYVALGGLLSIFANKMARRAE